MKSPAYGMDANKYAARYQAQIIRELDSANDGKLTHSQIGRALGFEPGLYFAYLHDHGVIVLAPDNDYRDEYMIDPDFNTVAFLEACDVYMAEVERDAREYAARQAADIASGALKIF